MKIITASRIIIIAILSFSSACPGPDRREVTFIAVGDIMLGRHIGKMIQGKGGGSPFERVLPVLRQGDIVFGNLESVMGANYVVPYFKDKPYNFIAPPAAAELLREAGFSVLNLANNHALDYGPEALEETRSLLNGKKIKFFGAGKDLDEARRPAELTAGGLRFGFLGYSVAHSSRVYATQHRAGIAPIQMEQIRRDIQALREKVDVLVISLHWGIEYEKMPTEQQRKAAHQIIDWGADMIIGHHPHVLQGVELYKGKVIAYSFGNFIFDQKHNGTDRGAMIVCKFRKNALYSAEIVPLGRHRTYFPMIADGEVKKQIVKEMKEISLSLNAGAPALSLVGL